MRGADPTAALPYGDGVRPLSDAPTVPTSRTEADRPVRDAAVPAALAVTNLRVTRGDALVLDDVSFTLPRERFLAVIGPNGAGKSTLVQALLGLVRPDGGEVRVFDRAPRSEPRRIGYVPQLKTFDRSFPATALELVVSGARGRWPARITATERDAACAALERVGATRLRDRPLARLSGGELQRAFLARALVREPDLVILDEPATGVDFLAEHDLNHLLEGYQRDARATVLMVTHDLAAARHHASDVLVLNRTRIGFGPPERALTRACLEQAYGHVGHDHDLVLP